jgi:glycosyltransferase involved in cell wall biosynthesis
LLPHQNKFSPVENRFAFCDSFAWDNHCLTQQYLRAMISMDAEILFIIDDYRSARSKTIMNELKLYEKATIFIVPKIVGLDEQSKLIYNQIVDFKPAKIFLQTLSVVSVIALNAIKHIPRYRINLADHLYWAGTGCVDYLIEFRNFGFTVSHQKRGFPQDKILIQPYYPIIDTKSKFRGFPDEVKSKTIIFSGGEMYKICDKNYTFFEIMKRLLSENPSLIILFSARGVDTILKKYIKTNNLEKRIKLLGYRDDINEVFKNCDIFLQTFPFMGGLMSQYAALNGKPILSYSTSNMLEFNMLLENSSFEKLGHSYRITYTESDDFFKEAKKLISDMTYREFIGEILRKIVITPEQFNKEFRQLITTNKNIRNPVEVNIDYLKIESVFLESQNQNFDKFYLFILYTFRFSSIIMFPKLVLNFLPILITKYHKNILKKLLITF